MNELFDAAQREVCVVISGGDLDKARKCKEFVEMVARLHTREEAHPDKRYDLPPLGCGDAEESLDKLIYRARELTRQGNS